MNVNTASAGVDLARAARLVLARQGSEVEKEWAVKGACSGSPLRGPEGEIFVSRTSEKKLERLSPNDGEAMWSASPGGGPSTSPLMTKDGQLLVGANDGNVYALDPRDGRELWHVQVPSRLGFKPFEGKDGLVYFPAQGTIAGIDLEKREVAVQTPLAYGFEAAATVGPDGTVYGGGHDGDLYALTPGTGDVKWHKPTGGMLRNSPAVGDDGSVYAGCIGKTLVAFDPSGNEKWRFPTANYIIADPVVTHDGTVLAGSDDNKLYAIDPDTGKERWHFDMNGQVRVSPSPSADGVIYAVSDRNRLYGINANTGAELWHAEAPSYVHCAPSPDGRGGFVFGSNDNSVVAMRDPQTRQRVDLEKTILADPSTPEAAPTIEHADGFIVVDGIRLPVRAER